ncbi:hypothetical protein BsWGS_29135 [Bradybaena similaris]
MSRLFSLRFKKIHLVLLFGCVFLVWNFITFYTLSNKPRPMSTDKEIHLANQLQALERAMGMQAEENRQILNSLQHLVDTNSTNKETNQANSNKEGVLPILMIACDRTSVSRALDKLLEYRPSAAKFPIIVSQDCGHAETAEVIHKYVVSHNITHIKQPDLSNINLAWPQKKFVGYYKISRHYKWALDQIFVSMKYLATIIVEDDLEISPDFYEFFSATYPILQSDPYLWCVSAWNDNGKEGMVSGEAELLYRTDFFPGLGWMIERKLWLELRNTWPEAFWDDWMRHPAQRKGRECIRPEICRTSTFGRKGVSKGLYFDKHLKFIKLNSVFVPFTKIDLSYLEKNKYDETFTKMVYSAPLLTAEEVRSGAQPTSTVVRVEYTNKDSFKRVAALLGIMDDFKAGVPRAAYRGVVSFMFRGRRVFLTPPSSWTGYDTSWT